MTAFGVAGNTGAARGRAANTAFEITLLTKIGGPLTKQISLNRGDELVSDGSACVMGRGRAERIRLDGWDGLATLLDSLSSSQAIALGQMQADLSAEAEITTTEARRRKYNGSPPAGVITRTLDFFRFAVGHPGLVLIDVDFKGMPDDVRRRIEAIGGAQAALQLVLPEFATAGCLTRASTSAGLINTTTGKHFPSSGGLHVYLIAEDAADIPRFLRALHARMWLAGFGWCLVGKAGQCLERSLVDSTVASPERLVFEGAPVLVPPIKQDSAVRAPQVRQGPPIDTRSVCRDLDTRELAQYRKLIAVERERLAPDAAAARAVFLKQHAADIAKRTGMSERAARNIVEKQVGGILLPSLVLPWDDSEFDGCTVADVLADPGHFVDATLADPIEGIDYGRGKAKVLRGHDGGLAIHSFAHGLGTVYVLRYDADAISSAMRAAAAPNVIEVLTELIVLADIDPLQRDDLCALAKERTGKSLPVVRAAIKQAEGEHRRRSSESLRQRLLAQRTDPRPQVLAPNAEAEWLPTMSILNDVLGASRAPEPPMRSIDGFLTAVRARRLPNLHALTSAGSNAEESKDARLPSPQQPILSSLDENQVAELIEEHIQFVDRDGGTAVHLGLPFVRHFVRRHDEALPIVAAIATLPIVLGDGSLLRRPGLHRDRGIVFRVPPKLVAALPTREQCDEDAVLRAFQFLKDEWFIDVATDYPGKCVLIAAALTLIERSLLPERPAFFITAGRRGGGKTTTLIMLLMAITGLRPAAAAWSPNEEERRKAILAYLMQALPCIIWDNIKRGSQISCPHVERSCTAAFYSDRRLGVSELVAVAAAVIHFFTGNNIGSRGELAARALTARLEVDRADPENRNFRHPDPVAWTEDHRTDILVALYTLLLGNPALRPGSKLQGGTRFKTWQLLVGSTVEYAAYLEGSQFNFQSLFLDQEGDDEETVSLADALLALQEINWPEGDEVFKAADLANKLNNNRSAYETDAEKERRATLREFLFPELAGKPDQAVTAKAVGKRLKRHIGEPVISGQWTLCLRTKPKPPGKQDVPETYFVLARRLDAADRDE